MAVGLAAFIPSILGVLGSLFKGKKTQQAPQQTPQQLQAYTQLLQMLMKKNQQGSDPMNQIRNMFYGQQTPQQPLVGMPGPQPNQPRPY
jgi:Tfp pilus assembly protein PilV